MASKSRSAAPISQIDIAFLASAAELGHAVLQARLYRGLSQEAVAAGASVSRSFVVRLENGKPNSHLQKALAVVAAVGLVGVVVPVEATR